MADESVTAEVRDGKIIGITITNGGCGYPDRQPLDVAIVVDRKPGDDLPDVPLNERGFGT